MLINRMSHETRSARLGILFARNHRYEMNSYGAKKTVLLSYRTIMKAYGKQHVLYKNELACVQPMQEVILNSKPFKYIHYITMYLKK
jgi:hypothetical protein